MIFSNVPLFFISQSFVHLDILPINFSHGHFFLNVHTWNYFTLFFIQENLHNYSFHTMPFLLSVLFKWIIFKHWKHWHNLTGTCSYRKQMKFQHYGKLYTLIILPNVTLCLKMYWMSSIQLIVKHNCDTIFIYIYIKIHNNFEIYFYCAAVLKLLIKQVKQNNITDFKPTSYLLIICFVCC